MLLSDIRAIVFDVGRVLVDFTYDDCFRFLAEYGAVFPDVNAFAEKTNLSAYERGRLSSDAYLENVRRLLSRPVDRSVLIRQWVRIFEPIPEMMALARGLAADYAVYVLSNTSALHWEYLLSKYHLGRIGKGGMASFEVGALKPEPAIFRAAERRFGLIPEKTVFVDDIFENVAGATACGWRGIHHVSVEATKRALAILLEAPIPL